MAMVMQEAVDVLRQVQKLSKELNPVKTALLTLKKREQATPSVEAAAASLDKIAARVESVCAKYDAYVQRLAQLTSHELPELFLQTPLLAAATPHLDAAAAAAAKNNNNDNNGSATLLDEVCPGNLPYVVSAENYRSVRDALRLRVDIVTYLLATGRVSVARHVADAYRLPRLWFPQLWASATATTQQQQQQAGGATGVDSVMATPLLTATPQPRARAQPHTQSMARSSVGSTPARSHGASAPRHAATTTTTTAAASDVTAKVDKRMPALVARVVAAALFVKDEYMDRLVLQRMTQLRGFRAANEADDDEEGGGADTSTATATSADAAADAVRRAHVGALLARAGAVQHGHLCTQSSSPAFDAAMMSVVEHVLAHTLDAHGGSATTATTAAPAHDDHARTRHNNSNSQHTMTSATTTTTNMTCGSEPPRKQRTVERRVRASRAGAPPSSSSSPRCMLRGLTPEELLLADDAWHSHVLFIKRPTRYYCMYSGTCMNDGGDVDDCPLALANGHVVSRRVVTTQPLLPLLSSEHDNDAATAAAAALASLPNSDLQRVLYDVQQTARRIFVT